MAAETQKKEPTHCITYVSTFLMFTQQCSNIALVNLDTCCFFVFFLVVFYKRDSNSTTKYCECSGCP